MGALEHVVGLDERTPRAIASALSRAIRTGALAPGERLPTVREVATELGVSPATVSAAWQALRRTGLVVARGRSGTFVLEQPKAWLSERQRGLDRSPAPADAVRLDLSRGTPDPALLPSLGPALGRAAAAHAEVGGYWDEPVLPALRRVLEQTWPSSAETVTVVDGATDGIERTLEQVVSYGDRVALESPGFPPFFDLVEALGAEVVPLAVDAEGVLPASLAGALERRPVAVVLQPRAQNPTGASMSATRAAELARVLAAADGGAPWVIEDDHSGAISTAPDVTLATHLHDRVVHVRSFSKSHGPDLRIAALGGPVELVDKVVRRRMLGPAWTSRMVQGILLDLLTSSQSLDQLSEARRQYFARQRELVARLADHGVEVATPDGVNLWLPVGDEPAAVLHLAAHGIRVAAGSPFLARATTGSFVRVTSGMVPPDLAGDVAAALAEVVAAG